MDGSQLAFEITEGFDMEGQSDILRCLKELETLGIRIWLDDSAPALPVCPGWALQLSHREIDRSFLLDCDTQMGKDHVARHHQPHPPSRQPYSGGGHRNEEQLALMRRFRIDDVQAT